MSYENFQTDCESSRRYKLALAEGLIPVDFKYYGRVCGIWHHGKGGQRVAFAEASELDTLDERLEVFEMFSKNDAAVLEKRRNYAKMLAAKYNATVSYDDASTSLVHFVSKSGRPKKSLSWFEASKKGF